MLIQLLIGFMAGTIWSLIWYQLYRTNKALNTGSYSIGVRLHSRMHWIWILFIAYLLLELIVIDVLGMGFNMESHSTAEMVMLLTPIFWAIL